MPKSEIEIIFEEAESVGSNDDMPALSPCPSFGEESSLPSTHHTDSPLKLGVKSFFLQKGIGAVEGKMKGKRV